MSETYPYTDKFSDRHIGPDSDQIAAMLKFLGVASLEELIDRTLPAPIRTVADTLDLEEGISEHELSRALAEIGANNQRFRSFQGTGYNACITPAVIQRNILENPGWYTQYTPYQSEIAQGRLEALLNFQTMVIDLTGMEIANSSLLDESTAAAEAMGMIRSVPRKPVSDCFFVAYDCHPQTIEVVKTRADYRGWEVVVGDWRTFDFNTPIFGALLQYPTTEGAVEDYSSFCDQVKQVGGLTAVAADLLSLCLLRPPGEFGADIVVGSTQRFGMPMGYGGPHAAFFATHEAYKRQLPGRIIGLSTDAMGHPALRMALQTREQHIKRDKATSNICTAQVLPAVVASMYAVYHGPEGLRRIATRVHALTRLLCGGCERQGLEVVHEQFFDTLRLRGSAEVVAGIAERASASQINLRPFADGCVVALDETTSLADIEALLHVLTGSDQGPNVKEPPTESLRPEHRRASSFMSHPVFSSYRSETELLRYIKRLEARDLSLTTSMIPLGSCTMKLNAAAEMLPITWPQFADLHPFAPTTQCRGYQFLIASLGGMIREITGFAGVSLQPNSGAQGEYSGLLVIREYHRQRGDFARDLCLIPASAHGTNPASAVLAGMAVVVVDCDEQGNIDVDDLRRKAEANAARLAALMVTYPSTHGVFEVRITDICEIVHANGGQVYMDGANLNALVGLCRPADIGIDVCHLNLHKTFCIPHGGGGPGMGPIATAEHLADYLPGHPLVKTGGKRATGPVAAAPWGSALILLISWAYLKMMGANGLRDATRTAILNANYIARRLDSHFPVLYTGEHGFVAHEAIIDLRQFKSTAGITVEDVAKRLMDYGFHAPTVSFPVAGTLMIEPTESESKGELDRFCDAMISIHGEIAAIESGEADPENNLLKNAPHTLGMALADPWKFPYSREQAVLPVPWLRNHKFWPAVARLDNAQGDRNLVCSCQPVSAYA